MDAISEIVQGLQVIERDQSKIITELEKEQAVMKARLNLLIGLIVVNGGLNVILVTVH